MNKSINNLKKECLSCRKCDIGGAYIDGCLSNVFSNMKTKAKIMVIGQSPGHEEVLKGEPFVGTAGLFFNKAVKEVLGMKRSDFYISNAVRCFTPEKRGPSVSEIENCREFLDREIRLVNPKVIISLGAPAFKQITGMSGLMKRHGVPTLSIRYGIIVVPLLHPSPLNTNNPDKKKMFYEGLSRVGEFIHD